MDIVDRLRTVNISWSQEGEWCAEAADEIVRLRLANSDLQMHYDYVKTEYDRLREELQNEEKLYDEGPRLDDRGDNLDGN